MRLRRLFIFLTTTALIGFLGQPKSSVAQTFSNPVTILINDNASATPYPSSVVIAGLDPTLNYTVASVLLNGVSHTSTSDIDVLLVGPAGKNTLLMSDNFGDLILNNVNLEFSDSAAIAMGGSGNLSSQEMAAFSSSTFNTGGFGQPRVNNGTGRFKTSNIGGGDIFPSPAPTGPYTNAPLSTFNAKGSDLNGQIFSLFVRDDAALDNGQIAGGWQIQFSVSANDTPEPGAIFLFIFGAGCFFVICGKYHCCHQRR